VVSAVRVSGWGRTSWAEVTNAAIGEAGPTQWPGSAVPRGLGRSYGDAAQVDGGFVFAPAELVPEPMWRGAGTVRVHAATSIDELLRWSVPQGWFVPVSPGTRFVTVGGAIAADVHGKNHHRDGSFCAHVRRMRVATPGAGTLVARPGDDVFRATAGGMGLTGVVLDADVRMLRIATSWMSVGTRRVDGLDDAMACLAEADGRHRYSVAWIDLLARGAQLGRGVVSAGDHASLSDLDAPRRADPLAYAPRVRIGVPDSVPGFVLNRTVGRAFYDACLLRAPRSRDGEIVGIAPFFHPLDALRDWNRLYGRRGFLQHQFVLPDGREGTLRRVIERLAEGPAPALLGVLKRFGPAGEGLLSFPRSGWTLAADLPDSPAARALLDSLDEIVVQAGGRTYFAKDARMRPRHVPSMYPNLLEWRQIADRLDPDRRLTSDLNRRLGLRGSSRGR